PRQGHFDSRVTSRTHHKQGPQNQQQDRPARPLLENILLQPHQPDRQKYHPYNEIILHLLPDASIDKYERRRRQQHFKHARLSLYRETIYLVFPSFRRRQPEEEQRGQHVSRYHKSKSLAH